MRLNPKHYPTAFCVAMAILSAILIYALITKFHQHKWVQYYEDDNIKVEMCETCHLERWITKD